MSVSKGTQREGQKIPTALQAFGYMTEDIDRGRKYSWREIVRHVGYSRNPSRKVSVQTCRVLKCTGASCIREPLVKKDRPWYDTGP